MHLYLPDYITKSLMSPLTPSSLPTLTCTPPPSGKINKTWQVYQPVKQTPLGVDLILSSRLCCHIHKVWLSLPPSLPSCPPCRPTFPTSSLLWSYINPANVKKSPTPIPRSVHCHPDSQSTSARTVLVRNFQVPVRSRHAAADVRLDNSNSRIQIHFGGRIIQGHVCRVIRT